jgi:integrase
VPRVKLTAGRIRELTSKDKKQTFLWDTEVPGLAVRATAGAKAFVFQGKLNGKDLRMTIGDARAWGIDDARAEARRLQTLIDKAIDPRLDKQERLAATEAKQEEARRAAVTVEEAWQAYTKARHNHWGERHRTTHEALATQGGKPKSRGRRQGEGDKTEPGPLAYLMPLPLNELNADRVKAWLAEEASRRPTYARLAFACLRAFINWCADHPDYRSLVDTNACAARISRNTLPKKQAKNDCLQREQLAAWFAQVRKLPNPVQSAYLQALLLTGARREELARLRWEDVDFQWRSLTIRDKVDGERAIPLTPYVSVLLQDLKRRNNTPPNIKKLRETKQQEAPEWKPSLWVFNSRTAASGRIQEPRIAHNKAIAAAGLPPLSLHGLRRSFGTLAEWVECPTGVAAQIMGHKPSATAEKHYKRRPLDLLRMWHEKIENWILTQAEIELVAGSPVNLQVIQEATA